MGSSSSSPPPAPDPTQTAQAQARYNQQSAQQQQQMNMTNQATPYGSLTYSQTGETWPDGTPRYSATQSLSPEMQGLFNQYTANQQQFGNIAGTQLGNVASRLSTPWSFDASAAGKLTDMQRQFLDPEWNTRESSLENRLANQGITPGSEAWNTQQQRFSTDRGRAYDQMYLDAYNTAQQTSLQERNQPLNELTALMSGSQVTQPNYAQTPQSSVAAPDYQGAVAQNYQGQINAYNQEQKNQNAMMGGLFGLGSAGITAAAPYALPLLFSDRRLKTGIERIGDDPRGWGVYAYRYLWDTPDIRRAGYMADEVEMARPDAVAYTLDGFAMIDYEALR